MAMKWRGLGWVPTESSAWGWRIKHSANTLALGMTQQELDKGVEQVLAALKKN